MQSKCILHFLSFFKLPVFCCILIRFTDVFSLFSQFFHVWWFPEKGLCRLSHFWGWFREEEEPRKLVLWGTLKLATAAAGAKQPRLVDQEKRRYFVLRHPKPLQRGSNAWICSTTQQLMTTELLPPTFYFNKHPLNFSVADYSAPLGSITRLYVLIFHLHCSS